MRLLGLHHVTAIASDPRRNLAFYTQVLGLRLVKKTVNFDDPGTYHLYYGDYDATPGSLLTFFLWPGLPRGQPGAGMVDAVAYAVPAPAIDFWRSRLGAQGVAAASVERLGDPALAFADPDGLPLELIGTKAPDSRAPVPHPEIPADKGIRGFHSVTLAAGGNTGTGEVLSADMGFQVTGQETQRARYALDKERSVTFVDVKLDAHQPRGRPGVGTVHHVAFRTPDDASQNEARAALLARGFQVSPVMDRSYFHSIYYREPGGILFEIATDGPGFAIDEPRDQLGQGLKLPPWQEPNREAIRARLPPLG